MLYNLHYLEDINLGGIAIDETAFLLEKRGRKN